MPRSAPIVVYNTGIGLKAGDPDPHWQIVSRSDDPKFKPQPAVVRGMKPDDFFLEDDPNRSQWLSLLAGDRNFPEDVIYVFRTEFDLTGRLPSTAVLRGKFLADDRVVAHPLERPPSAGARASRRRSLPRFDEFPDRVRVRQGQERAGIRRVERESLHIAGSTPHYCRVG